MNTKTLGQVAYEAYCNHTDWKSLFGGASLPQWELVKPEVKAAWEAAGAAVEHLNPVQWNPYNKVVQDHRDGSIFHEATNTERAKRGLPVPWTPDMGDAETRTPPSP